MGEESAEVGWEGAEGVVGSLEAVDEDEEQGFGWGLWRRLGHGFGGYRWV